MKVLGNDDIVEYGKMVSILSKRMISNTAIAEEAAQEVWVEVVKSLPSFREESELSTWIYAIAKRIITKYAVNERHHSTEFLHDYITGHGRDIPDNLDMDKELWIKEECDRCLTGLFHCLSNEARMIYIFRDVIQLSFDEISEVMGKDEPAVRKVLSRSRTTVTAQMRSTGEEKAKRRKLAHDIITETKLTQELADTLIDKVYIYPDNRVEIAWRIRDFAETTAY